MLAAGLGTYSRDSQAILILKVKRSHGEQLGLSIGECAASIAIRSSRTIAVVERA